MARPTKFEEPLARPRSFRLRKSDDEKLAKKLKDAELQLSEYIREILHQDNSVIVSRPQRKLSNKDRLELIKLIGQVQKVGNNVNQVAHRLNSDHLAGTLSDKTYRGILLELESISFQLKECLPKWD